MARCCGEGVHELPRSTDQRAINCGIRISRQEFMATHAQAAKSKGRADARAHGQDRCSLFAEAKNPSSLARHKICRQTPKVGAECVNCACSDLCGGCSVMGIPTAIPDFPVPGIPSFRRKQESSDGGGASCANPVPPFRCAENPTGLLGASLAQRTRRVAGQCCACHRYAKPESVFHRYSGITMAALAAESGLTAGRVSQLI